MKPKIIKYEGVPEIEDRVHLDVRSKPEWLSTGVIKDSILIPLPEL